MSDKELLLGDKAGSRHFSLNPAAISKNSDYDSSSMIEGDDPNKTAAGKRTMSLATRAEIDPMELVEQAKANCKQPIKLSWSNVFFEVDVPTTEQERLSNPNIGPIKRQEIVKSVSGFAAPGQATFIMGSSGAGKTSLLNILADRVSLRGNACISGSILFND